MSRVTQSERGTVYHYSVTLATGETITIESRRPLQHWKSALMHRATYGTAWRGASWSRP